MFTNITINLSQYNKEFIIQFVNKDQIIIIITHKF